MRSTKIRLAEKTFASLAVTVGLASTAIGASITGSVTGPDGKPFMGAFVVAENAQNKITFNVLSDEQGHYHVNNLPAATYTLKITAIGYKSDPRPDVQLAADAKASFDFALQKTPVRWGDLNTYQGRQLLPKTANHDLSYKDPFFTTCLQSCHSFQTRMTPTAFDENGWRARVQYMRDSMGAGGGHMTDQTVEDFTAFLTQAFGPDSKKPKSPEDMPQYKSLVRPFSPSAMNIAYVEYDFHGDNGLGPWSAVEDKDGMMWIPYYGRGNEVVRLNPKTAELTRFPLPFSRTAGVHSVIPSPDGTVWLTEASLGRIAQLNPATGQYTEYQNTPLPDGKRTGSHTIRVDEHGMVWVSGGPAISEFDPKTEQFKHFDVGGTYGNVRGQNGDEWFTSFVEDGPIARVTQDGVLTKFYPPTKGKPQRLQVDSDGIVWFTERRGGKIGRLDPKTGEIKEFQLPGPEPSPYAIGIDRDHMIWYSSHEQDTLGRFDPKTGQVTEYPFPHSEIAMREFFLDSQGRMWYASSVNNKVGYFYYNN
ncbi:MAG TPA: carboxypeptidase regulatory-like domain-containing protein [Xanthobacteraceae bacterium]|nr:carboxypeptidase regulatory-like domain-containing protein [Xanthobacteraceae bacterium]